MLAPLSETTLNEIVKKYERDSFIQLISAYIDELNALQQENENWHNQKQFISMLTHQLATPVTSLAWTLENANPTTTDEETLDGLREKTKNLSDVIRDLTYLLNIEQSGTSIKTEFPILELVKEILKTTKEKTKKKNIRISCRPTRKTKVLGNPDEIKFALLAMIDNAITYNKPGGEVSISLRKNKKTVTLRVKDTGYGIPKKEQNGVFTKFFRASNASLGKNEGSGVGLFIAKQIAESHGCKIGFSSVENRGSIFWLRCPSVS
ncbi:HAMP domain-containing histidine kinase [Candidatus Uhrbacteria bacterium]|nr:HAMP domain-containing histidine kinase [Candidatus Uhrbacteria bacterium]